MKHTTLLLIMDGYGLGNDYPGNAIIAANTPNLDRLFKECPHTSLKASGLAVGLPEGQMGNSEVGHMNMGAGRVVWQELTKISKDIEDGDFFSNETLKQAMVSAKEGGKALHLMGLLSDGGVHSHINHAFALIDMAKELGITELYIHPILDGRDVPPTSAEVYLTQLEEKLTSAGIGRIAHIMGRYYAMDRDKRWDRIEKAYKAFTEGDGRKADSPSELLAMARKDGENDEFVLPGVVTADGKSEGLIRDGDSVIFFNFRPDRAREITRAFVDPAFDGFKRQVTLKDLNYVCFTTYDETMPAVSVAFPPQDLKNTLGEYVSSKGLTQLRIAETEKYAHVTFFFNGGVEAEHPGEDRLLVPSPGVATYDLKPSMSAVEVTENVIPRIESGAYDMIILNYANCDMVGHTGVFPAAVSAVETVDSCVGDVVEAIKKIGGHALITADHGNADRMLDEEGNVVTAHSTAPVPLILVSETPFELKDGGSLSDIGPTMLELMGLEQPQEMTGHSLLLAKASAM